MWLYSSSSISPSPRRHLLMERNNNKNNHNEAGNVEGISHAAHRIVSSQSMTCFVETIRFFFSFLWRCLCVCVSASVASAVCRQSFFWHKCEQCQHALCGPTTQHMPAYASWLRAHPGDTRIFWVLVVASTTLFDETTRSTMQLLVRCEHVPEPTENNNNHIHGIK